MATFFNEENDSSVFDGGKKESKGLFNFDKSSRINTATENAVVNTRTYNLIMCGTILYGLVINFLTCTFCTDAVMGLFRSYLGAIFIVYFVLVIIGTLMAHSSTKPIVSFIGYNFIVVPLGITITPIVVGFAQDTTVVASAFLATTLIVAIMTILSLMFPDWFSKLGGALFIALIGIVIVEVVMILFGMTRIWSSYIAVAVFSLYIGFDVYRSQAYDKTVDNAIDSAIDIYLDIINLFIRLIAIFGRSKN